MEKSCFSLVLNAHLPFVRRPEFPDYLEERWLFEAISECYLPMLRAFRRLESDGVPFRLTLSISPTLQAMLTDPLLQERYITYAERQLAFAMREIGRNGAESSEGKLAAMYAVMYETDKSDFQELYQRNILRGFDYFHKKGMLELITTSGTHAFMPLYGEHPESEAAQIETAIISHRKNFGKNPQGFWLPHLGYYPGLERILKSYNLSYAILDPRALIYGDPIPFAACFAPVRMRNGYVAFARDSASAKALYDGKEGYPAAPAYRDFYRDVGYDLPADYVIDFMPDEKTRVPTGFKYRAIGMDGNEKGIYDREKARAQAREHASNFVYNRKLCLKRAQEQMDMPAIVLAAFDAELLGHWWFEGVDWLEAVLRELAASSAEIRSVTPSEYLEINKSPQESQPEFSSWAENGYCEPWLEKPNAWLCRHIYKSAGRMVELADRFPNENGLKERALNQAAREILLMQNSDWPYLMRTPGSEPFAKAQMEDAIGNFAKIYDMLSRNAINTEWLTRLEKRNNLFPFINYRMFRRKK
jgi:1,4-alpha-glucan branching enzyme